MVHESADAAADGEPVTPRSDPSSDAGEARRTALSVVLLLLVAAALFGLGIHGEFVWDDWALIVRNEFIRNPEHLPTVLTGPFWNISSQDDVGRLAYVNLYRPWVSLAYATQFQLFGENPLGYHVVSLLLHLGCIGLAFAWLRQRLPTSAPWSIATVIGCALFAIHPSRPETVAWISGSTDLWMTLWVLLGARAIDQDRGLVRIFGGLCFALAVFSKEAAILVPLLLIADTVLLRHERPRLGREGLAFAGAILATVVHAVLVPPVTSPPSDASVGPFVPRVLSTLGHLVVRSVWPFDPSVEPVPRLYDATGVALFAPWSVALGAVAVVGLLLLGALAARRPRLRPWLADACWFFLPLVPVLNLVDLGGRTLVTDRYLYLPLLGLSAVVARGALPLMVGGRRRALVLTAAAGLLIALSVTTLAHIPHFRSDEILWQYEYDRNPGCFSAINGLASAARVERDADRAVRLYLEGRDQARRQNRPHLALTYALQAVSAMLTNTSDAEQERLRAIREFYDRLGEERRLRLELDGVELDESISEGSWRRVQDNERYYAFPRALAYARTGELIEAEAQLRRIVAESPRFASAWSLLATVNGRQHDWREAQQAYERAARRLPGQAELDTMGGVLARAHALAMAPAPDEVTASLRDAEIQIVLGSPEGARQVLRDARERHPTERRLVLGLARAEAADGRFDEARRMLQRGRAEEEADASYWIDALRELDEVEASSRRRARERRPSALR